MLFLSGGIEMKDKEKCPVCGSKEYKYIEIKGSDNPSVCLGIYGSVDVICCLNCGVLRVSKDSLEFRIKNN